MMNAIDTVDYGSIGLTFSTNLAIDGLLGTHTNLELPRKNRLKEFQSIYINIDTLCRNILESIKAELKYKTNVNDLVNCVSNDIYILKDLFVKHELVFYHVNFDKLYNNPRFKEVRFRTPNTDKQKVLHHIYSETVKTLISDDNEIIQYNGFIEPKSKELVNDALIITHMPIDLLCYPYFKSLKLLESNTGVIKEYKDWYTKYYKGSTFYRLPFRQELLFILGDSSMIEPNLIYRPEVIKMAEHYNWTPEVTEEKVKFSYKYYKNDKLRSLLNNLCKK